MSTAETNGRDGSGGVQQRELVFCHECQEDWYRDENELLCPLCGSDFVEIIENTPTDPTRRPIRLPGSFDDPYDSDDDDGGDRTYSASTFLFEAPGIRVHRTSGNPMAGISTNRSGGTEAGGEGGQHGGPAGPNMVEMLQAIFASIMGEQGIERARQQAQGEAGAGAGEDAPRATGGDHAPQDPRTRGNVPPLPPGFQGLFGGHPPPGSRFMYERHTIPSRSTVPVEDLPSFLQQLFGGAPLNDPGAGMIHHILGMSGGGPGGDYVWTEGQLDRVISELMEQHQGNAPPPAPPEVLNNLPKIRVDAKRVMEGEDCAVCKEDLVLDEEVAQLPCKHVYHEECIKRWLQSRDTCPICRASTTAAMRAQQGQQQQGSQQQQQPQPQIVPPQARRSWASLFGGPSRHSTTPTTNTNNNGNNNNSGNPSSTNPSSSSFHRSWHSSGGGNNTGNQR